MNRTNIDFGNQRFRDGNSHKRKCYAIAKQVYIVDSKVFNNVSLQYQYKYSLSDCGAIKRVLPLLCHIFTTCILSHHSLPIKIYNYATSRFSVPQAVTVSKVIYYIQAHSLP